MRSAPPSPNEAVAPAGIGTELTSRITSNPASRLSWWISTRSANGWTPTRHGRHRPRSSPPASPRSPHPGAPRTDDRGPAPATEDGPGCWCVARRPTPAATGPRPPRPPATNGAPDVEDGPVRARAARSGIGGETRIRNRRCWSSSAAAVSRQSGTRPGGRPTRRPRPHPARHRAGPTPPPETLRTPSTYQSHPGSSRFPRDRGLRRLELTHELKAGPRHPRPDGAHRAPTRRCGFQVRQADHLGQARRRHADRRRGEPADQRDPPVPHRSAFRRSRTSRR